MVIEIKKFEAVMAIIDVISILITIIAIAAVILMIIGNYTFIGKKYQQIDDDLTTLVQENILSETEVTNKKSAEKTYLYGRPTVILITAIMLIVVAIGYVVKGFLFISAEKQVDKFKKEIEECLASK